MLFTFQTIKFGFIKIYKLVLMKVNIKISNKYKQSIKF